MHMYIHTYKSVCVYTRVLYVFALYYCICRYSSRVDMYVSKITACLKDESVLVRKQTLTLLTHLLQVSNNPMFIRRNV